MIIESDTLYYIAHNGADVFHHGKALKGDELTTGQPNLETFTDFDAYLARLNELNLTIEDDYHGE